MHRSSSTRLSILHVSQPNIDGVARCVAALAAEQEGRGWRVGVATPPGGELDGDLAGSQALFWDAGREVDTHVPREIAELRRILLRWQPDVVHLHSSKAGLAGRLILRGRRLTVFQPHGWSFNAVDGAVGAAALIWERVAGRWADALVCVSETERRRGTDAGIRAPWRVVPNGIDLTAFGEADVEAQRAARMRLGLEAGPLVVCLGRFCREKGQDVLLRAWPSVLDHVPEATLVLVGEGPDAPLLHSLAPPGVLFPGKRLDARDWLAAADVVAAPSRSEGMSIAMLEAMACGRSIVMGDVPGAREAIGDDAGAIVPVEDSEALARALVERLRVPRRATAEGRAGRARVERSHDVRQMTARIAGLYDDLLARRGIHG